MRLVVEEAQDHNACMEKLRSLYGADCVVVHSFRVDERYRVVIALETDTRARGIPQESAVKNVVSNPNIRWDTLVDGVASLDTPLAIAVSSEKHHKEAEALQNVPSEISSGLIELAARIKALEALEPPSILEPESEDFRKAVFSDVLAEAAAAEGQPKNTQQQSTSQIATQGAEARSTSTITPVTTFPAPVEVLIKTSGAFTSKSLNTNPIVEETPIPRVCTSDSAENFASLLLSCITDSQKSLPLYGQTQLRMVAS